MRLLAALARTKLEMTQRHRKTGYRGLLNHCLSLLPLGCVFIFCVHDRHWANVN